jgi:hypothetical protein
MHAPTYSRWVVIKHILRYIQGTTTYGLHITRSSSRAYGITQLRPLQATILFHSFQTIGQCMRMCMGDNF